MNLRASVRLTQQETVVNVPRAVANGASSFGATAPAKPGSIRRPSSTSAGDFKSVLVGDGWVPPVHGNHPTCLAHLLPDRIEAGPPPARRGPRRQAAADRHRPSPRRAGRPPRRNGWSGRGRSPPSNVSPSTFAPNGRRCSPSLRTTPPVGTTNHARLGIRTATPASVHTPHDAITEILRSPASTCRTQPQKPTDRAEIRGRPRTANPPPRQSVTSFFLAFFSVFEMRFKR